MNFNRHTVAVAFAGVAGLAVLSGPSVFSACCFATAALAAFLLNLEI